ncbi:peptidoglycan DD-metalloendopeptidase family protein [Leptolyngbya sp. ST-U4]|uniref:peptidoglycan DD-metalloendopeptidase family protein n=1 Tax=Leptolyngbya sp. ST-U4 TaxID=2933912 RepID=UPI003296D8D6
MRNPEVAAAVGSDAEVMALTSRLERLTQTLSRQETVTPESAIAINNLLNRVEILSSPPTPSPVTLVSPPNFTFAPESQPLVGVIDTGFSGNNPDIDYSRVTLGRDWIDSDSNLLLKPGEGSGKWADSLVEFVDAAKQSEQPNAVVNLSLDLTQINPDGSITTRYELTVQEKAALAYAQRHNVLVVVSSGDQAGQMSALGKASLELDNVITVGAAARVNDAVALSKAYDLAENSGSGAALDILADGSTKEASAQVTTAISQVWAANPKLNYTQVIDILKRTATDLGTPNWDMQTGSGLLNIIAAVHLAKATEPELYTVKPGQRTITDNFISQPSQGKQLPGDPTHPAATLPGIPQTNVDTGANSIADATQLFPSATVDIIDQVSSIDPIDVFRTDSRYLQGADFSVLDGELSIQYLSPAGQLLGTQVLGKGSHKLQLPANVSGEVVMKIERRNQNPATYMLYGFESTAPQPFKIDLEFESLLTPSQRQILEAAAKNVASLIGQGLPTAIVDGKIIDDINIKISTAGLDGAGGTQARTKIDFMRYGSLLPAQSLVQFDAGDIAELERSGQLFSVAQHEFLHALGFGNLWEAKGLVDYAGTPLAQYNGKQAVEEFSKLGGATNYVPLETEGDGSANLHWNDALFQNEVMTFDLGSQPGENGQVTSPISAVTIASLGDLGYQINLNQATPNWGLFGEKFHPENVTEEWLEEQWKRQAEVDSRLRTDKEINLPLIDPATVAPEIWAHAERGPNGQYYDWQNYLVTIDGDSLSAVAQRTMGNADYWKWIADRNGIYDAPYWIYLGDTIQIPVHRPNYEQEQEAERRRREQELRDQQEREARERQEAEERLRNDQAERERLRQDEEQRRQEAEANQRELEEQERRLREQLERRRQQEEWEREQARLAELARQAEIARQQGKGGLDWYFAKSLPEFGPVDPFETSLTGETVGNLVPDDYYRFTLSRGGRITAELRQLLADADLVLYDVRNKPIAYSMREGITDEQIIADLIPGTYMLRVNSPQGMTTDYDLIVKFQHKLSATQTQPLPPGWRPTSIGGNPKTPLHANPTEANPLRGFLHPLNGSGTITQGNGGLTSHTGRAQYAYDFGVPIGTPVYAMRSGTVVGVVDVHPDTGGGYENRNNFNYVLIEHDGGYRSAYLHLKQGFNSRIGLKVGDTVNAGQLIGYSGNSGWSTGPHLHVEVHKPTAGGYFGQTVPFVIGGDAAGDDNSSSDDSATDDDSSSDDDYDYDEEDDSLPIGQLIANEVVELTRESLKGLNQAISDGIRSQFDGIINSLQDKVDEAEKKVTNLKSQLESKTDGIIDSISGSVIGGLNATAKNELRNAINEVTDGDFLGGAASVTQAVLAKLSSIGLGFVSGLIEGWIDDRINDAFAPVEEALKTANQALQSAKEELNKVNEVVQEIIDQAIDAAADQLNEWTPYVANLVQALFYAGEEWVNNLTNPEFWMNPELWKKFAEFVTGLLITAIVSYIAGAIAGAIGTAISAAGLGITIPAGLATAAAIFATIMGALIGAYMSRDELMTLYESAKTAFTNLNEGAKSSTTDEQLQFVGERFASEYSDALGKLVTIVANVGVGARAGGAGAKAGSSITNKLLKSRINSLARVNRYGTSWPKGDLNAAIKNVAGSGAKGVPSGTGKILYKSPDGSKQVVQDPVGKYFRIQDLTNTTKRSYLDQNANSIMPNNLPKDEYQRLTHFKYQD